MEKRKLEKLGIDTSLLGFGCMRFPTDAAGKIDEVQAEKMLDKAIAEGVNYIDTAYPYHDGESEPFVGRVLKKFDRGSFYLATKLPVWLVKTGGRRRREDLSQPVRTTADRLHRFLSAACNEQKQLGTNGAGGRCRVLRKIKRAGEDKVFRIFIP